MLRRQTLLLFLAALAGVVFAQTLAPQVQVPAVVQAKSFVLLDDAGRKRGEMSITRAGQPLIQLFDDRGRVIWDSTDEPKMRPLLVHPSF
jgi:hypothetical protein